MLADCNAIRSGRPELGTKVSGCYSNWMYRKHGSFQLPAYSRAGDRPGNFRITPGLAHRSPGRRSSKTEAAPVSYCCVTNPPNRGDLTKACASSSRAPGPAGTRRVSGPAPPIPGLLGRLHSRAGLLGLASRGGAGGGDAALCHLERHPLAGCPGRALTGEQGSKSRTSQTAFGSPGRNGQVVTPPPSVG